ncbi:hypothetical protein ALP67_02126 [Pseudomonas ficuserectae]|nr:hypothetical protein ALP67_02126 [Pseudomonas ficuserectae]
MQAQVRVEAIQLRAGLILPSVHRTHDEPAVPIHFAIVEPIVGQPRFGVDYQLDITARQIKVVNTRLQRNERRVAIPAQGHGTDFLADIPGSQLAPVI